MSDIMFSYVCFRLWEFRRLEAIPAFKAKMWNEVRLTKWEQHKATKSKLHITPRPPKAKVKKGPKLLCLLAIWALELQTAVS